LRPSSAHLSLRAASTFWEVALVHARLRAVDEIAERSAIVEALRAGELYWCKLQIAAPIKDTARARVLFVRYLLRDKDATKCQQSRDKHKSTKNDVETLCYDGTLYR
jgi:hypothetical protein